MESTPGLVPQEQRCAIFYSYRSYVTLTNYYLQENTFQTILISDGTYTYAIFVYYCGRLEWGNGPIIGYNAAGERFDNHDPSSVEIACLNFPASYWQNVVYRLSTDSSEIPVPGIYTTFSSSLVIFTYTLVHASNRASNGVWNHNDFSRGFVDSSISYRATDVLR